MDTPGLEQCHCGNSTPMFILSILKLHNYANYYMKGFPDSTATCQKKSIRPFQKKVYGLLDKMIILEDIPVRKLEDYMLF